MSASDFARMTTEDLIQRFIDAALRVGGGFDLRGKPHPKSPQAQEIRNEIRAIAEELRARKPIDALRQLYDHESPDVRSWASGQFMSIDPEWALSSFLSIGEGLTTGQVVTLRERARKRPPRHPTLAEMSTEQLVARFEDAGIRRYATQFLEDEHGGLDIKNRNRIVDEMGAVVEELKARDALGALLALLDHPNLMVRYVAATYCLPIAPERAVPSLEAMVAERDPIESLHASNTLGEWRRRVHGTSDP